MKKFVIISKDAMCKDYVSTYGNKRWETPNIDAIANQGTVFHRHYTAAPSTVMSFYSMATGKFAHESGFDVYEKSYRKYDGDTLFKKLRKIGYDCHIVWANNMMPLKEYLDYFQDDVCIHATDVFRQPVGSHYIHDGFLKRDSSKIEKAFTEIESLFRRILEGDSQTFLWVHFPHVIAGEVSYGSDIELFDRFVGMIRKFVSDDSIVITADHGNMNGRKGKLCYGFDVYESNICVPFITPKLAGQSAIWVPTSSLDLFEILFEHKIPKRRFIYSDSAYRAQPNRKIAIIKGRFKYIYNKKDNTEELYDLEYDPYENFSIMEDYMFDQDRKIKVPSRELYYYPDWDCLSDIRTAMRRERMRIWENGRLTIRAKCKVKNALRPIYEKVSRRKV